MQTNDGTRAGRRAVAGRWQLVYVKRFVALFGKFKSDGSTNDPGTNDNGIILSIHLDASYSDFFGVSLFFVWSKKIKAVKSIEVVKKTFRYSNVFFYNHLCRTSVFRNIIMESGIKFR
jgi:hypothetical protein